MDAEYLQNNIGHILDQCLSEVAQKRPWDPIEYISQWLYKYTENKLAREQVCQLFQYSKTL